MEVLATKVIRILTSAQGFREAIESALEFGLKAENRVSSRRLLQF